MTDRWARGDEIACSGSKGAIAGGCRNLAVWLFVNDLVPGRNWISCDLHRDSHRRLMIERGVARNPETVPFQDPGRAPLTKRRQVHLNHATEVPR